MATKDSPLELHQISTDSDSEGSDPDSDWDDSEGDPDYDMLEETHCNFSNLSLKNKAKTRVVEDKGLATEIDPQMLEMTAPSLDDEKFEIVQKTIKAGLLEKLKVDECKLYLRKNGLRLTGNKDTLIQRIKEHLEIINGEGEKKYPPFSFVLNCKGDACTGDVVLFEQNVYEMFNIASRSASGPPCGKRIVAGRIVKESYGAAKQQHTFTIEVLWSKGEKPLPPLYPLLIKGRNLYRLKTLRQKWEDEGKRQKILMEKHSRGSVARADREARIEEKERRKKIMENRISKKDSAKNQRQPHSCIAMSQHQRQETDVFFPSQHSGLCANARKETSAIVNKPAAVTEAMGSDQLGNSVHNQQAWNHSVDCRSTFYIDHMRGAVLGANNNYAVFNSREKQTAIQKYHPFIAETDGFTESTYHRKPLASANHFHPLIPNRESYNHFIAETDGFTERTYRKASASANHVHPLIPNRESYKQKQLCRHFSRGRCYFGDNCKFLHDLRNKGNA